MRRDELYHYGVRGQKWGTRRYQYENGTWTEEGKRRRRTGNGRRAGAYDVDKNSINKNKSLIDDAMLSKPSSTVTDEALRLSRACKLPLKHTPLSIKQDLALSNTHAWDYGINIPNLSISKTYKSSGVWKNNCVKASYAYALRRSGLNVTADSVDMLQGLMGGMTYNEASAYMKNKRVNDKQLTHNKQLGSSKKRLTEALMNELGSDQRAYGMYIVSGVFGAHAMAWEKLGDKIYFLDPQNNSVTVPNDIFKTMDSFSSNSTMSYVRLDNAKFDETKVKDLVRR